MSGLKFDWGGDQWQKQKQKRETKIAIGDEGGNEMLVILDLLV